MKKIILQQALAELEFAVEYYEEQQSGLGLKLKEEINETINWILRHPVVPRIRNGDYRRVNLKVFPYYIAYIIRNNNLWILAVAHSHQEPKYWVHRKNNVA